MSDGDDKRKAALEGLGVQLAAPSGPALPPHLRPSIGPTMPPVGQRTKGSDDDNSDSDCSTTSSSLGGEDDDSDGGRKKRSKRKAPESGKSGKDSKVDSAPTTTSLAKKKRTLGPQGPPSATAPQVEERLAYRPKLDFPTVEGFVSHTFRKTVQDWVRMCPGDKLSSQVMMTQINLPTVATLMTLMTIISNLNISTLF
jgi:hypothetical protein